MIPQKLRLEKVKVKELFTNIPIGKLIVLNELIDAVAKIVYDRIGILWRKLNRNTKLG